MHRLQIAYLLEDTALSGGIRVILAQADALIERGHEVTLIAKGEPLRWRGSRARWEYVPSFDSVDGARFSFVVGTFWTTIATAYRMKPAGAVHLCQGYEGSFTAYRDRRAAIEAAYRLPVPKMTVSPHLVQICRRFGDDVTYIGQIVDADFFHQPALRDSRRPRVLVVGQAQGDMKGIDVAYAAVRMARQQGASFELIRVSSWPPATEEPAELAAEFLVGLDTAAMARLIAGCDIFIGPNRHQEGFGLPAAEAMASGLAPILTEIPSYQSFDAAHDFALFVPEDDSAAMSEALMRLLADHSLRRRLALRGREVAEQFRAHHTGLRLERYFLDRRTG
jgi:glycosyltransferase involved in cell wall biosynthesis